MSDASKTYLCFDHGERRIGVAVGQSLTRTATPLTVVKAVGGRPAWQSISELVEEWQPDAVVVGLPLNMDGTEQSMTRSARRFGHQLEGRYRIRLFFAEERLTTQEARSRPAPRPNKARERYDAVAAQVILESWMAHTLE